MLEPGDHIDIWVVEKALGSGGMGSVYRCHNRQATRILAAVKVLESGLQRSKGAQARFIREAEILFRIDHPNVVKVRNVRMDTEPPYLEMEFVSGESLEERLRRGPIPMAEAVELGAQLADAVAHLHELNIRHRDIKPGNLLVQQDGRLKLVDFGLAMEADVTRITQSGVSFGTVSYAPPEWINPDDLDPVAWDLYAVGVVLWEMLTAKVAFPVSGQGSARQQAMQVMMAKQNHPPLDPGSAFSDDLRALVRELTDSDRTRRLNTATGLAERLRGLDLSASVRPQAGQTLVSTEERPGVGTWADDDFRLRTGDTPPPTPSRADAGGGLAVVETEPLPTRQSGTEPTLAPRALSTSTPPGSRARRRPTRRWVALGVVGASGLGLAVVAVVVAAAWVLSRPVPLEPRPAEVVVSGLPAGSAVALTLDGQPPAERDDLLFRFPPVAPGEIRLAWALGEGCAPACLDCPPWCVLGETTRELEPGQGSAVLPLSLSPPDPREVTLAAAGVEAALPLVFRVGEREVAATEGEARLALAPGAFELVAEAGACPAEALGCWPSCPDGCASWQGELVVPAQGEVRLDVPISLAAPAARPPRARPAGERVTTPPPRERPTPAATPARGAPVTYGAFARWLAGQPEWQRDEAISSQRADQNYLSDWVDGQPPPGREGQPVVNVSWNAAAAFCAARGGLAALDAEPLQWTDGAGQPAIEWRTDGGRAAWRDGSGTPSHSVRRSESNVLTGFRCNR